MEENLISIIIPTFNEEAHILDVVQSCRSLAPRPELIVCDGGSTDGTMAKAASAGVRVLRCAKRGRSFQMNEGALQARGGTLVFLHADTRIGPEAWDALQTALRNRAVQFGAFRRRFAPPSWVLSVGSYLASWRGRIAAIFLGDQAIFVRADTFRQIGGYREILLFEDVDLCVRLRKVAGSVLVPAHVTTSSRRFEEEGDFRRFYRNIVLWFRYWSGTDPNELARGYYPDYYDAPARADGTKEPCSAARRIEMEAE